MLATDEEETGNTMRITLVPALETDVASSLGEGNIAFT